MFLFPFVQKCDTYQLIMEVRDMGGQHFGLFNTGTITISLEDENDNAPYFTETAVSIFSVFFYLSSFTFSENKSGIW